MESYGECLKSSYQELFRSANSVESSPPQLPFSLARVLPVQIDRSNIWDEFTKSTVRGSPDDILHLKEPIDVKGLLGLLIRGQKNNILLEGPAGIGKTTLLLNILEGWSFNSFLQDYLVVVYVPLWDASIQSATSLEEVLQLLCKSPVSREEVASCIQQNEGDGVVFFLDGWQEASEAVLPISSLIFDNDVLPKSNVIISTCPAFSAGLQQHASARVELLGSRLDSRNEWLEKALGCEALVQQFVAALEAHPVLLSISHFPTICETLTKEFVARKNQLPLTITEFLKAHLLALCCNATSGDKVLADQNFVNLSKLAFECFLKAKEIITTIDLESFHLDCSALPKMLKHVSLSSSGYRFSTPLFQHFLVASRIAQLCPEEQCEHLKAFLDNPRHSEVVFLIAGLTKLKHSMVQRLVETLMGEHLGEPQCLVLLQALFEAQREDICRLTASSFSNEIILSSLYLSPTILQAVGYFAACSSQLSVIELHLRKCSLDDKGVGILMHYLEMYASEQPTTTTPPSSGIILNLQLNRTTVPGTEYIAKALQNGVKLLSLNLGNIRPGYNNIRDPGAEHLCRALVTDVNLVELCLSNNSISAEGAATIGQMLVANNSLQKLDIQGNIIGEKGTITIAESLKQNTSLRSLNLYCCYTADGGIKALADALTINTSVVELNLSKNEITGIGAEAMGSVLAENCSLKQLNLCSNWIDDSGLECITSALQTNTRLATLDVMANTYTDAGRRMIATCLRYNRTVCMLRMDCSWVIGKELKEINVQRKEQGHEQLKYKF